MTIAGEKVERCWHKVEKQYKYHCYQIVINFTLNGKTYKNFSSIFITTSLPTCFKAKGKSYESLFNFCSIYPAFSKHCLHYSGTKKNLFSKKKSIRFLLNGSLQYVKESNKISWEVERSIYFVASPTFNQLKDCESLAVIEYLKEREESGYLNILEQITNDNNN